MSQLTLNVSTPASGFLFDSHAVRILQDGDDLWFAAQDVMSSLEYASTSKPAKVIEHVPDEWRGVKPIHTPGGTQQMLCLSEPGLYFFLGRSDKPKALPFQKWLAKDVLPSIRKTGSYVANAEHLEKCRRQAHAIGLAAEQEAFAALLAGKFSVRVMAWATMDDKGGSKLVPQEAFFTTLADLPERLGNVDMTPGATTVQLVSVARAAMDRLAERLPRPN